MTRQRRKSIQSLPDNLRITTNYTYPKLTRIELDNLHKCKPNVLYYEKKIPDNEKPSFENSTAKNAYMRTLFNQLSEKKRHKYILKSTKKWKEYLESNPIVVINQIPTLHLLLTRKEDIHYYFLSLGLPIRPPISAPYLYNNEKQQTNSQQNWVDLSQTIKDEYVKRLLILKREYHLKFVEFVEKVLPSDYIRLEFFRNIKHAVKDYDLATKRRIDEKGAEEHKTIPSKQTNDFMDVHEFDRIKQKLLGTELTNKQKKLVERLGQIIHKHMEPTVSSD